jgi:hypothetical protein
MLGRERPLDSVTLESCTLRELRGGLRLGEDGGATRAF